MTMWRTAIAGWVLALAPACSGEAELSEPHESAVIGTCTRDEALLRGDPIECAADVQCPCGSYCDTADHECRFDCMVPPAVPAEGCATGTQCDDTGRCVAPAGPPSLLPTLSASPLALHTVAGGASKTIQVQLVVTSPAAVAAAQSTQIRAIGRGGAQVSCTATTFVDECSLTAWTFAFDGAVFRGTKPVWVRTVTGTPAGSGDVQLRLDASSTELVIPATASVVATAGDGIYNGSAAIGGMPSGFPVSAFVRTNKIIVRDPSRVLSPDGALVLELTSNPATAMPRGVRWLAALDAPATAGAITGQYRAGATTIDAATGALHVPVTVTLPGGEVDTWAIDLTRQRDVADECATAADCPTGNVCPSSLHACVPSTVWSPPAVLPANLLDDPRSKDWWEAVDDLIGVGDAPGAPGNDELASTGADMIESLMCMKTGGDLDANTGRLGMTQLRRGLQPPRSGDLTCVNHNGETTTVPSAVGLATYADRKPSAISSALLETCLDDLARSAAAGDHYNQAVGQCVNLARFLPALRLLSTGELDKRTRADRDARGRGLFARLVQQWSQLHGFLASTGLSEREYDDAIAVSPDEPVAALLALLDVLDKGWGALLDKRVAARFPDAATWAPESATDPRDYRLRKRPVVYWAFNGWERGVNANRDLVQDTPLVPQTRPCDATGSCPPVPPNCAILATSNSLSMDLGCRGYQATLPLASLANGGNVTAVFNYDPHDVEMGDLTGTILAMPQLAVIYSTTPTFNGLLIVHPTAGGGREEIRIPVSLGHWISPPNGGPTLPGHARGSSVAIVRDAVNQTYTLYAWHEADGPVVTATHSYTQPVSGSLSQIPANRLYIGVGPYTQIVIRDDWWNPYRRSIQGTLDDVAIYDSLFSKRELERFGKARTFDETRKDLYPSPMSLTAYDTQEIMTPVGAALLEAQVAHFDVVARLAETVVGRAQASCDTDAPAIDAEVAALVARIGRTVRQSLLVENLARTDLSQRAVDARKLLVAKRSALARRLGSIATCSNPYGMGEDEVPLYFGSISPDSNESAAFFAASDHLLALAEQRANTAQSALLAVQTAWVNARQSQIQQLMSDSARDIRVDELETRYGDGLLRLCGIADRTAEEVMADATAGTFDLDTCFVQPTTMCLAQAAGGPILEADPTCYRGALGAALMDTRAAYHSHQAAYQAWQAAVGNAEAAERLCIFKEMDAFGCDAVSGLEGVTCPPGHQGTIELISSWNDYLDARASAGGWFDALVSVVTTIGTMTEKYATSGPGAAFITGVIGAFSTLGPESERNFQARERRHQELLQKRAEQAEIVACWNGAQQYERAIAAAEETALQAQAQLQAALIAFQNRLGEGREALLEGPVTLERERTRPSLPIAFHYWLPEAIESYRVALDSARRYTYVALRATEYDTLDRYDVVAAGRPARSGVLGAWRPNALLAQLALMRDQTNPRTTAYGPPALDHITFDLGAKVFGIPESSPQFGATLRSYSRPVYSSRGEYLGLGVRFSLVPQSDDEAPTWRCAERIWRANVGTAGYPTGSGDNFHLKLFKRNSFASRQCDADGFRRATLRPGVNLLAGVGEPQAYVASTQSSVADISVVRLDTPNALDDFRHRDSAYNASSTELGLQGLYGDYVLLFPAIALSSGLDPAQLFDFNLRFDYLSVDDTPMIPLVLPRVRVATDARPIVID